MTDLRIVKLNEVYVRIYCNDGIAHELSDFFCFQVPNFQFHPLFRKKKDGKRVWDGKKRLFNKMDHSIYYGLLPRIKRFCDERGYTYVCEDEFDKVDTENVPQAEIDQFITDLAIPDLEVRDYQAQPVYDIINNKRRLLLSPTSSGKSLISYILTRWILAQEETKKILIVVPRLQLVHQLYKDFQSYGWTDVEDYVHPIFQGQSKNAPHPIYVSTWQSLQDCPNDYFHQFDAIICDESHEAKAKELTRILECGINAKSRIGMTGTLDGTLTHKIVLEGLFGPVINYITTRELMDQGFATPLNIKCVVLKYPETTRKMIRSSMKAKPRKQAGDDGITTTMAQISRDNYNLELEFLLNNRRRNMFITQLAIEKKGNVMVTFQFVKGDKKPHGKILYEMISKYAKDRKVFFIHGEVEVDVREQVREITEQNDNCIIVASSGVFSMGINIKNLHHLILASPSKARIRLLQTIGRILRLNDNKTIATLYDIADDLRVGKWTNYTLLQFEKRIETYNEESFDYKVYPISLGD